jgi:hypothetical protein
MTQPNVQSSIPGYQFATIGAQKVSPTPQHDVYHGTSRLTPEEFKSGNGFPLRGNDIDLIRHVEPPPGRKDESAFLGTVFFPSLPEVGATEWAMEGGWVYHIHDWPGYCIETLLKGKIPTFNGYRDPHMKELEIALPAGIPSSHIKKIGLVVAKRGGLAVNWMSS